MVRMRKISVFLAVLALAAGSAMAATIYEAELTPELVQPSSGASAYGQATLIINDGRTAADLTLNFAGLDTPQTGVCLMRGLPDMVGAKMLDLPTGTPMALTMDYDADIIAALESDELFIQIYSEAWPDGAIRGNFAFVIVPTTESTWSGIKTLFE